MENIKEMLFEKFVRDNGVDKFTKVQEYVQKDSCILDAETLSMLSRSLSGELEYDGNDELGKIQQGLARLRGPKFTLSFKLIYRKKAEVDIIMIKVSVSQFSMGGDQYRQELLKDGSMFLLFDESETIKLENGDYHAGTDEDLYFQSDLNFLLKAVNAKNIEYRCVGKRGVISEGKLNDDDLLKVRGFYAALFDPEFGNVYDAVLKKDQEEKAARDRKAEEERVKKELKEKKAADNAAAKKAKMERLNQLKKEIIDLDVNGLLDKELLNGDVNNLINKIKSDENNIFKNSTLAGFVLLIGFAGAIGVWWYDSFLKALVVVAVTIYLVASFKRNHNKKLKMKLAAEPTLYKLVTELLNDYGKSKNSAS